MHKLKGWNSAPLDFPASPILLLVIEFVSQEQNLPLFNSWPNNNSRQCPCTCNSRPQHFGRPQDELSQGPRGSSDMNTGSSFSISRHTTRGFMAPQMRGYKQGFLTSSAHPSAEPWRGKEKPLVLQSVCAHCQVGSFLHGQNHDHVLHLHLHPPGPAPTCTPSNLCQRLFSENGNWSKSQALRSHKGYLPRGQRYQAHFSFPQELHCSSLCCFNMETALFMKHTHWKGHTYNSSAFY